VLRPVNAILAGSFRDFRILVIDQSRDARTANALAAFGCNPRVSYVPSGTRGLSSARNEALRLSDSDWVAFTDDDCEPASDWLERLMDEAGRIEGPAMVFGTFRPNLALAQCGMVPGWRAGRPGRKASPWREYCLGGFGGNMAINRAALGLAGCFHTGLGRGAVVPACEEGELAFRLVLRGGAVHELLEPEVLHHGVVKWRRVRRALSSDYASTGFVLGWYLRHRRGAASVQLLYCLTHEAQTITRNIVRLRRPVGFRRPLWLLSGVLRGLRHAEPPRFAGVQT
jgi:glycosyltransferase involved in cell wall biosynthesis